MGKTEKYLKLFLYMTVLVVPLAFVQRSEDAYYLPKMIILSGAMQYVILLIFNARRISIGFLDKILIGFLFVYGIGIFTGGSIGASFFRYLEWVFCAAIYLYIKYFLGRKDVEKLILTAIASGVLVAVYAVIQVFGGSLSGWVTDFSGRAFSSFGNPDFLGGFLILVIPLSFSFYCYYKRSLATNAVLLFLTGALLLSQTRSSLAAFSVSLLLMMVIFRKFMMKNMKILIPGIMIVFLIIVSAGLHESIGKRIKSISDISDSGISGRVKMWKTGMNMVKSNMFSGVGIYNVRSNYYKYKSHTGYIQTDRLHNDYIEIAAESGVLAFLFFIVFVSGSVFRIYDDKRTTGNIVIPAVAGFLIHAFFNFPFFVLPTKLYFFVLLGAAANKREDSAELEDLHFKMAAVITAIVMITFLRFLAGSIYLNYGINSILAKDYEQAKITMAKAGELYPWEKKDYFMSELLYRTHDYKEAKKSIYKYMKKLPGSKDGSVQSAMIYATDGELDTALGYIDRFLKYWPGDTDVLNNKGKVLYMKKDVKNAIKTYNNVLKKDPGNKTANYNLYGIYYNEGMRKESAQMKERIEKLKLK